MTGSPRLAVRFERRPSDQAVAPSLLWSPDALARWGMTLATSFVLLVGGWFSTSGTGQYDEQVVGLAVAVGAVILAAGSGVSLVLKGRRAVGQRRLVLLGESPVRDEVAKADVATEVGVVALVASSDRLRYHRADCVMARGRDYPAASGAQHESQGRLPCGVCRP